MKNIKELRDSLANNYVKLLEGEMPVATCAELANTAGKILSSVKYEMEYNRMTGETKKIDFMEYGNNTIATK